MTHVQVNGMSTVRSSDASFMVKETKNKNMMTQTMKPSTSTCSNSTDTVAVINPVLENGMTVRHLADYEVWSEAVGLEHKGMAFPPSTNDRCNHSLNQSGVEKWAKHYSNRHKILLVGEGDFSFSASLAAAFGSASNMTATSLDSERGLWKVYDRAVYNIGELMRKGCKVIHGVNATAMDSHPCLKGLTFDRIIFNFPFAVISKKSKKSRTRPHRVLVKAFMRAAREMVCENGEIHITQRTDEVLGELKIEFLAFQQWLELVGVADFNVSDYPGYTPKWEIGSGYDNNNNGDYIPSKTYKFRRPHPPPKIVPLAATKPASSAVDYVPKFSNANILQRVEISTELLKSITLEEKEITSPPSSNCYANHYLKQKDMGQEKWVKHYSSSHKMLLVGEGDFSFSASLATAFGSASNMTATSLNPRKVLNKDYDKAVYNIKELKRMGCKVMYRVDATAMASHPRLKGSTFDRIIFNFPYAVTSSMLQGLAFKRCRHQTLVREFLQNAKKMIGKNGEIHITHRVDGEYSAWRIDFIASELGLELVEAVDFSVADYPGYNAKWGFGGDYNFDWFPSKTYKFRHPHPPWNILSFQSHPEPASCSTAPNLQNTASKFDVAPPCFEQSLNLAQHSKGFCYDTFENELNFNLHPEWCPSPSMILPYGEAAASSAYTAQYYHNFLPSSEHCINYNSKQNERVQQVIKMGVVVAEEKRIKHYSNHHKMLLVGEGDFSFSASLAVAFGSASNMTATSLDSEEFLTFHYCKAFLNLKELKKRGCKVIHGVDATSMAYHPNLMGSMFDRIIFNFPYAGFFNDSSRESKIGCHQSLIWMFLDNAKHMICENGEIHITHKTNGFHQQWNIVSLAILQGLELVGSVKFSVTDYPGYSNKYGFGGDNSFDCSPSKTYMFRHPRTAYMSRPWV